MKEGLVLSEQIVVSRISGEPALSGEFDLTLKSNTGYSLKRGIFMPEPGGGEVIAPITTLMKDAEGNSFEVSHGASIDGLSIITSPVESIRNPAVRAYAEGFRSSIEPHLQSMPVEDLKDEYFKINKLSHEQRALGLNPDAVQPYGAAIIDEMKSRGVDVVPLFTESLKRFAKPGERFSGGAAALPMDTFAGFNTTFGDSKVARIAEEVLAVGVNNGATKDFLQSQAQRLRSGLDSGGVFDDDDAEALLEDINIFLIKQNNKENELASRNRLKIIDREGWNYTRNDEALTLAEDTGMFVSQAREIRDIWELIEDTSISDDKRREILEEKKVDIKRIRKELLDAPPTADGAIFYELQGLLSYEFNQITKRVEGNIFSDHEQYAEEIEDVRRIYHELDALDPNTQEAERDRLYTQLESILTPVDFASGKLSQSVLVDAIIEESLAETRKGKEHYGMALEYAVERIIGRGDDNVTSPYPQFGFYEGNNLEEMIQGARRVDIGYAMYLQNLKGKRSMSHELFKNMKARRTFVGIVEEGLDPGSMRFIEKEVGGISEVQILFEQEYARMAAFNSFNGEGWILHDQFKKTVDPNVERMVLGGDFDIRKPVVEWYLDRERREYLSKPTGATRKLRPWELTRAKNMGRSVSAVSLRRQYYGVIGDTPDRISERVETVEGGEEIMTIAAPLKLINERYFAFNEGSKMYLDLWKDTKREEARESNKRYAFVRARKNLSNVHGGVEHEGPHAHQDNDGQVLAPEGLQAHAVIDPHDLNHGGHGEPETVFGMFGIKEETSVLMDSGTVDVKSSMWRADKMFYDQYDYANYTIDGKKYSYGKYHEKLLGHLKHAVHSHSEFKNLSHSDQGEIVARLRNFDLQEVLHGRSAWSPSERMRYGKGGVVLEESDYENLGQNDNVNEGQRLFLGILLLDKNIDKANKTRLWKKASQLIPSRIAVLMPQYAVDEMRDVAEFRNLNDEDAMEKWSEIFRKLSVVEFDRVQEDARGLRTDESGRRLVDNYQPKDLWHYISEYNRKHDGTAKEITEVEQEVIKKWMDLGIEMSDQLAETIWPMAPFLTDVPQTDWERMGRDEMKRLLVNDHNDWQKAYDPITTLIKNPATDKPEEADDQVVHAMHEFVNNAMSPTDLGEAQARAVSFIYAWGKMAETKPIHKWTYGVAGAFAKKPTSMMEEFNGLCGISYDEEKMAIYLIKMAKQEALNADIKHYGKLTKTPYWKLTKKLKTGAWWMSAMTVRYLALIIPLEFLKAMAGGIVNEDLLK